MMWGQTVNVLYPINLIRLVQCAQMKLLLQHTHTQHLLITPTNSIEKAI